MATKKAKAKTAKAKTTAKTRTPVKNLALKDAQSVKGGRKAGKEQQEYLVVTMKDVIIS